MGDTVSLDLPSATGGAGTLTYTLTPALPAGLTFTASARRISGSPTAAAAATTYTLTATDAVDATAEIEFSITIEAVVTIPRVEFGEQTIPDQDYEINVAVNVQFPEATGGSGHVGIRFLAGVACWVEFQPNDTQVDRNSDRQSCAAGLPLHCDRRYFFARRCQTGT